MSACGIRHVAFVQTARRHVDSGRHPHNLIIVLQHSLSVGNRRELSVMGAAGASSLDQLLTVQLARDGDAELAKF